MGGPGSGGISPTRNFEMTKKETTLCSDSILKDEDVRLFLAVERGKVKFALAQAYEDAWKTTPQKVAELEPRQPVPKQPEVPKEPIPQEHIDEGYEE